MTTERLVEAINAHNAETGIKDVIAAAKITLQKCKTIRGLEVGDKEIILGEAGGLVKENGEHCVLAVGWKDGHDSIKVGYGAYSVNEKVGTTLHHPFCDVVEWFDSFEHYGVAARAVLTLLKEYDTE